MWTPDYFVRYVELPVKIEGVTIPNDDGSFDIYINGLFGKDKQEDILEHELCHIRENHFYNDVLSIREVERQANGKGLLNVFDHQEGVIPVFQSIDTFRDYIFYMSKQIKSGRFV